MLRVSGNLDSFKAAVDSQLHRKEKLISKTKNELDAKVLQADGAMNRMVDQIWGEGNSN
jgi:hypothetical protein